MIILPILLTGFKINYGGSRSIPVTSSLVLLLYQASGKKRMGMSKLKKMIDKVAPSTPKQGTTKPWLY